MISDLRFAENLNSKINNLQLHRPRSTPDSYREDS